MLGPVRSMSRMPILMVGDDRERASASWRVVLDLPTPPLPERTRMMFLTLERPGWSAMVDMAGGKRLDKLYIVMLVTFEPQIPGTRGYSNSIRHYFLVISQGNEPFLR